MAKLTCSPKPLPPPHRVSVFVYILVNPMRVSIFVFFFVEKE